MRILAALAILYAACCAGPSQAADLSGVWAIDRPAWDRQLDGLITAMVGQLPPEAVAQLRAGGTRSGRGPARGRLAGPGRHHRVPAQRHRPHPQHERRRQRRRSLVGRGRSGADRGRRCRGLRGHGRHDRRRPYRPPPARHGQRPAGGAARPDGLPAGTEPLSGARKKTAAPLGPAVSHCGEQWNCSISTTPEPGRRSIEQRKNSGTGGEVREVQKKTANPPGPAVSLCGEQWIAPPLQADGRSVRSPASAFFCPSGAGVQPASPLWGWERSRSSVSWWRWRRSTSKRKPWKRKFSPTSGMRPAS